MMKKILMTGIAIMSIAISSCDEDTTTLGYTLTNDIDRFTIVSDTFYVSTNSFKSDSVLARSSYSYLGRMKDPETGAYISSDFTTQFNVLENEASYIFAPEAYIAQHDSTGIIASSCYLNIIINSYLGDSLTAMKLSVQELSKPMEENQLYYTNFNPETSGYVRTDGLKQNTLFSIADLTLSDSVRYVRRTNDYYPYISIPLNKPYTDKNGQTYNNYGTYLMRTFYEHPEYFKNSAMFIQNVCPGFYIKTTDGLGLMSEVLNTQLVVNYSFKDVETETDTVYYGTKTFYGTEEVLQTTHITNQQEQIDSLIKEDGWTYLKTPAGIFTEVTLPVDSIKLGRQLNGEHLSDTITSAKIVFQRMNNNSELSDEVLNIPQNLLMIERDSLYSFFENSNLNNNVTSYLATYSSTYNTYSFNNISNLINHMYDIRDKGSANWNKVVLIPVQTTTTSSSSYYSTSSTITGINNEMSMTSVRLVGGSANKHDPVRISIIYNQGKK